MQNESGKISIREKICYGLGDSSANIFFGMTMMFLPYFYTDVVGLTAGAMGTLFLIARLVDAFSDPFIGNFADRQINKVRPLSSIPSLFGHTVRPFLFSRFPSTIPSLYMETCLCIRNLYFPHPDVCWHGSTICRTSFRPDRRSSRALVHQFLSLPTCQVSIPAVFGRCPDVCCLV